MSGEYVLTLAARRDVEAAVGLVLQQRPEAGTRLLDALFDAFSLLAGSRDIGHLRGDLTPRPVRFLTVRGRYRVVHRNRAPVQILRVLDGRRDVAALLR